MNVDRLMKDVKRVLEKQEEVSAAYLYGSTARGSSDGKSDVDVGLLLKESFKADPLYEARVSSRLDAVVGGEMEARILNDKSTVFLHQVLKYGKIIYSKDDRQRIDFEVRTYSKYLDAKPFIREYNRIRYMRLTS